MTHVASTGNLYLVHGNPGTLFKLDNAPSFNLAQLATLSTTPALTSSSVSQQRATEEEEEEEEEEECHKSWARLVDKQSDTLTTVCPSLSGLSGARGIAQSTLVAGTSFVAVAQAIAAVDASCAVTIVAGAVGFSSYQDGPGSSAFFRSLRGLVMDPLDNSLLTVDVDGCTIRKFTLGTATNSLIQPQSNLAVDPSTGNVAFFSSMNGSGSALALVILDRASGLASSITGLSGCVPGSASVDGLAAQACIPVVRDIAMADATTIFVAQPTMVRMLKYGS
ncbi:hypothetical protein QJQ45_022008 [Haematococcus lacustris]|nr:hypothetical protein QJQ45_022008 [Haematococcus lacustris]